MSGRDGVGRHERVVEGLPLDEALPALRAIARDGVEPALRRAGLAPPFDEVAVLRHHDGRRCTFALRAGGRRLVAKAYRRDVGDQLRLSAVLGDHDLAGGRGPTAAPLVAADGELRLLVYERLDGPSGPALLARGARVGELAADWLTRQWRVPSDVGDAFPPDAFLERVVRSAAVVAATAPELRALTVPLLAELERRLPPDRVRVLAHGSFSVNHVIDLGDGAGVIDWDGFCQAAPELDASAFLATLAREASAAAELEAPAAEARRAFRSGLGPAIDPVVLSWFEGGARIRNARHLCVRRPPEWLTRSERLLADGQALLGRSSSPPA
jgi:hypothetical protein